MQPRYAGDAGNDRLSGRHDDDRLVGGSGDDILEADASNDAVRSVPGVDTLPFIGDGPGVAVNLLTRTVTGGLGNDASLAPST